MTQRRICNPARDTERCRARLVCPGLQSQTSDPPDNHPQFKYLLQVLQENSLNFSSSRVLHSEPGASTSLKLGLLLDAYDIN